MNTTKPPTLTVAQLYEQQKEQLSLEKLSESLDSRVPITVSDINRPGMALMGFTENFLADRIQIIGRTEVSYSATLPAQRANTPSGITTRREAPAGRAARTSARNSPNRARWP